VKTVLVLGGYGTFGGRIAQRAAAAGFEVLVAGRSLEKARALCAGRKRMQAIAFDRDSGLAEALAAHRPWALVDAAGPFQGADYKVAEAAIGAGCHYLDIADGRDFVIGSGRLDGAAKVAGVSVVSGASSLPALSGAVIRRLAEGLDSVREVDIALSASSRGTAGQSVTSAILSYIGKAMALRRSGRWTQGWGWQSLQRRNFTIAGVPTVRGRLVALADVPDLALLPGRLPGMPSVVFQAGTDLAFHNIGLWLLSWAVRLGWVERPERLAGFLSALQRRTRRLGSLRSAMDVRLFGLAGARRVERRWTLIAERGEGPEIPSLAVPILLEKLGDGGIAPGAGDAGPLLSLDDFAAALGGIATRQAIEEVDHGPPLYARALGERFEELPAAVREMHRVFRDGGASGRASVRRGSGLAARIVAAVMRFPPSGEHALHVSFRERNGEEVWTRDFAGHRFASRLRVRNGRLEERFGPLSFSFNLPCDGHGLKMRIAGWRIGPVPLPLALAPRSDASEWEEDGRFYFDVPIALPLIGLVVHYRGFLGSPEA
jgi:NAD(P)-dependent dehydrogenase (short-subunit alcohol dehydrogenase family)